MKYTVRNCSSEDADAIYALYLEVAKNPGGLARLESEVSEPYVLDFVSRSMAQGISLVAESNGLIVGEIHAYKPGLFCFDHVLSDLTIAIHSKFQGIGVGRRLFEEFMQQVRISNPTILRVELVARESNKKAITFYESLGFEIEGSFQNRIRNIDGSLESDIPMAWTRN